MRGLMFNRFGHVDCLWYDTKSEQRNVTEIINSFVNNTTSKRCEAPTNFIHKQRVIKSEAEIKLMRKTCQIASESINKTIQKSKPGYLNEIFLLNMLINPICVGDSEHHIFARVDYYCRMNGASYLAYPPVVASGRNATTIHYINNSQTVNATDLVLMDAGKNYYRYFPLMRT